MAFVAQLDYAGLCSLTPEHLMPLDELGRPEGSRWRREASLAWALLTDEDADAIRSEIDAGRHRQACSLLLNLAVELLSIEAAVADWP